jgi:TonB family protein
VSINIFSQDTIYLEDKQIYSTGNGDDYRFTERHTKKFPDVFYSYELIKFSEDSFKIESCYYYNSKRYTDDRTSIIPTFYRIINDSTMRIDGMIWYIKSVGNNHYFVTTWMKEMKVTGYLRSIIPFIKDGEFVNYNQKNEPIYSEFYENNRFIKYTTPQVELKDSVYFVADKMPKLPGEYGDLIAYVQSHINYPETIIESAIEGTVFIKFVVTSSGEIVNIEIVRGADPFYDLESIRVVMSLPKFEPGEIKGKRVNVSMIIPVRFTLE